ncbi:MAG TPA: hypothetical protein VHO73_02595 [Methylomirabilota bacterium]|nr:hypothetical protein [Methylomirabilota bacterium]
MSTPVRTAVLASVLGWALLWDPAGAEAQLADAGVGFVMRSGNFGQPCTTSPGDIPIVYDNITENPVDVSVKVVNTGQSILFVRGLVIPPQGPTRRPRVMRFTLGPHDTLGIRAQGSPCGWIAVVRPH